MWLALFLIGLIPAITVVEFIAALFSARVRGYIVRRPLAHIILLCFAIFSVLMLIPFQSGPHHRF